VKQVVLHKDVGPEDVRGAARGLGWRPEKEWEPGYETDRQTLWSVDDRTTFVRHVEQRFGFQYLVIKGADERRVLNEILVRLRPWRPDDLRDAYRVATSPDDVRTLLCAIALSAGAGYDDSVFRLLREALEAPLPTTRTTAILATSYVRWRQWEPLLTAIAKDDDDAEVRRAAAHMLDSNRKTAWAALGKERNLPRDRWLVLKPNVTRAEVDAAMAGSPYAFVAQYEATADRVFSRVWAPEDRAVGIQYREDQAMALRGMVVVGSESSAKDAAAELVRARMPTWSKEEILALARNAKDEEELDLAIRMAGLAACGAFDAELVWVLADGLSHPSPFIREGVALAAQYAPWPEVVAALEEAFDREQDVEAKKLLEIAIDGVRLMPGESLPREG
jgi:hypothetical protein